MSLNTPPHALNLLRQDHQKLQDLFETFDELEDLDELQELIRTTTQEIHIHALIEKQVFYPAVKEAALAAHLIDQAEEEHQEIDALVNDLQNMDVNAPLLGDKWAELADKIQSHIQEEEAEIFPRAEESGLDLIDLGEKMADLRNRLAGQIQPLPASRTRKK